MITIICNRKYKCEYIGKCNHREAHTRDDSRCDKKSGGTSLYCHQGRMKSICVPISDGRYVAKEIKRCLCDEPKCNGSWVEDISHSINEVPERRE